ncbi:MAG: phosphatase PAP2 family protein [Acetatifactor sp.]|nr:phosphatase PAP2 family protein [Acetatifactor sp.]
MNQLKKLRHLIPEDMIIPLLWVLIINCIGYFCTDFLTKNMRHYDLSLPIDHKIPMIPWTVAIYFGCYLYWVANYLLACRQEKEEAYRFLSAEVTNRIICTLFFIFLPTFIPREEIVGNGFFSNVMAFLYQVDKGVNLFPSLHCLMSWSCILAVWKNPKIPKWYKGFSVVMTLAVFVAVLTTRQHYVVDILAGVAISQACYILVRCIGFDAAFRKHCVKVYEKIVGLR